MISVLEPYPQTEVQPSPEKDTTEQEQERALVKKWLSRIADAKLKWKADFDRMRANMEFVSGLQWEGQAKIDDPRYVNNFTLRVVNQKVATLYAKNPTAEVIRRERMDFQVWDENPESLKEAIVHASLMQQQRIPIPVEMQALFDDVLEGKERKKLVERVSRTLKILYQYFVDAQKPEFKAQMKQLVRRTVICGVGYVRPILCRPSNYVELFASEVKDTIDARISRIKELLNRIEDEASDTTSEHYATLRALVGSVGATQAMGYEENVKERVEFDFPLSTSIIPDSRCSCIREFVGGRWLAQEYCLPVEDVNAVFGTEIRAGSSDEITGATEAVPNNQETPSREDKHLKLVNVYEVFDKTAQTRFFICQGHQDFLTAPEYLEPRVSGFWNHFVLTFNDIEADPESKTSIFPPSDVQIAKHPQREWNRSREALRGHRNGSAPRYGARKGILTDEDKQKLSTCEPNSVTEFEGIPPEQSVADVFIALPTTPIDERLYDTTPLEQDLMTGIGMQQANIGPAQPNVTATVGTIAEQSRLDVAASNVDDLDGLLSQVAQASGELMIQGLSKETVVRIVGPGAAWPETPAIKQEFLNEVLIQIQAASSGRPNKALDISNFQQLAPLMLQAGANPVGLVKEGAKRLDDNLDVDNFFPLLPPGGMIPPTGGEKPPQGEKSPSKESATPETPAAPPPAGAPNLVGNGQSDKRQPTR